MADFMENVLNLYAQLSKCCTKQKLRMRVNLRILCPKRGTSKQAPINVPVVNPSYDLIRQLGRHC